MWAPPADTRPRLWGHDPRERPSPAWAETRHPGSSGRTAQAVSGARDASRLEPGRRARTRHWQRKRPPAGQARRKFTKPFENSPAARQNKEWPHVTIFDPIPRAGRFTTPTRVARRDQSCAADEPCPRRCRRSGRPSEPSAFSGSKHLHPLRVISKLPRNVALPCHPARAGLSSAKRRRAGERRRRFIRQARDRLTGQPRGASA
jgi:hypothetical protein